MKRILTYHPGIFIYCILLGLTLLQQLHADSNLFPMPSPNNKTVLVEINREAVSRIHSCRQLVEWCEMERSFDLDSSFGD